MSIVAEVDVTHGEHEGCVADLVLGGYAGLVSACAKLHAAVCQDLAVAGDVEVAALGNLHGACDVAEFVGGRLDGDGGGAVCELVVERCGHLDLVVADLLSREVGVGALDLPCHGGLHADFQHAAGAVDDGILNGNDVEGLALLGNLETELLIACAYSNGGVALDGLVGCGGSSDLLHAAVTHAGVLVEAEPLLAGTNLPCDVGLDGEIL